MDPNLPEFNHFFRPETLLSKEMAETCKGGTHVTIKECASALKDMENNKTPGMEGLTVVLQVLLGCYQEVYGRTF